MYPFVYLVFFVSFPRQHFVQIGILSIINTMFCHVVVSGSTNSINLCRYNYHQFVEVAVDRLVIIVARVAAMLWTRLLIEDFSQTGIAELCFHSEKFRNGTC